METIDTKVDVTLKACQEIIRYSPSYRFIYWNLMLLMFLIPFYRHIQRWTENNELYNNSSSLLSIVNNQDMVLTIIAILLSLLFAHFAWKYIAIKLFARKMYRYHKKNNLMTLNIALNKENGRFLLGKKKNEFITKPKVISTKYFYLFYLKKHLVGREHTFFLPKQSDTQVNQKAEEIIQICKNKNSIILKKIV
ncbi:hypothetical protein LG307_10580 [Sutcliffiella horikoshii]|uniref:hypothetical protein n=1 Tax=Sutcliffiella horikoshii TaxID=79883 RepID=UPI00384EFAA0